jgi:hypothetical protein
MYAGLGYREVPCFNEHPYVEHWFEKRLAARRVLPTGSLGLDSLRFKGKLAGAVGRRGRHVRPAVLLRQRRDDRRPRAADRRCASTTARTGGGAPLHCTPPSVVEIVHYGRLTLDVRDARNDAKASAAIDASGPRRFSGLSTMSGSAQLSRQRRLPDRGRSPPVWA